MRFLLAVLLDYLPRALASLLVALPVVTAVAGTGLGAFPEGDRLLFEPGGLLLSEVARALLPAVGPVLSASFLLFVTFAVLLLVPHAALLGLLAQPARPRPPLLWGRAVTSLPALLFVTGVALLAQVLALFLGFQLGSIARGALASARPWLADAALLATFGLGVALALTAGVARDLGRAAAVQCRCDGRAAAFAGLVALRRQPLAALGTFASAWLGAVLLAGLAAVLVGKLDAGRDGLRFPLVVLVHQLALAGISVFRVRWFERALELTASPLAAPDATAEELSGAAV